MTASPETLLSPAPSFCGVETCDDLDALAGRGAEVAIFGAGHGTPYRPGRASHAANAPGALRRALGWISAGPSQFDFDSMTPLFNGARVVDCGDLAGSLTDGAANRAAIAGVTGRLLDAGCVPLLLGGDDSTPIPMLSAYAGRRDSLTVVQVDAHIDWRDEVDGVTHGFSSTMRRASEMAQVVRIVQIGARGPGSARRQEVADARAWGAQIFPARELHRTGLQPALDAIPEGGDIFLSIDVDGLDPALVPGVLLPAFGGLGWQQALDVVFGAARRGRIVGAAFVEYAPQADPQGLGAQAVARLACCTIAAVKGAGSESEGGSEGAAAALAAG